jgi:hypothetical protein
MSKIEVNAIEPQSGTTLTLGASGDTITIPAGATISNQGTAAGFGPTGAVSWNTTKITADPNPAVTGVGYFADTTSAAFTITLPSSPSAGAVVGIADYANTFATNNLTVGRNGSNIGGVAANSLLSTNGLSVTFVYVDATQGWIVTDSGNRSDLPTPQYIAATGGTVLTCGDFKTHVFTGPGTFTVTNAGNPQGSNSVEYLVVAGGGGGGASLNAPGSCASGGAGGAGGYRQNYPSPTTAGLPVSATAYPITIGGGGPGVAPGNNNGTTGSDSIFSTITSSGGGGGGSANRTALNGGSGGGGGYNQPGGTGNTPPTSPSQGNSGGSGGSAPNYGGGGGGGAGATGPNGQPTAGGAGGAGSPIATTIFGPTSPSYGTPGPAPGRYFAGGGGGGVYQGGTAGVGGAGGGGAGGTAGGDNPGNNATPNTGGGGGGATKQSSNTSGGNGGSGIVIIRYKFQ